MEWTTRNHENKRKRKRVQKITIKNKSQTKEKAERAETGGALSYPIADGSEHLLWTLRFDVEDWLLGGLERLLPPGRSDKYPTTAGDGNGRRRSSMANCSKGYQEI